MTVRTASLPLTPDADPSSWAAGVLAEWGLPQGLARTWLGSLRSGLASGALLALELDAALGLVTVEVRDEAGRVVVGLDDWVGSGIGA